jgi:hypothetical protein
MLKVIRGILAVVAGYAAMVVLITLVQESWLGGVVFGESSLRVLILGGAGTFLAAMIGGVIASAISGWRRIAPLVMCAVVVVETTTLVVTGRVGGPLWFDLSAAASLLVGIMFGAELLLRLRGARLQTSPS